MFSCYSFGWAVNGLLFPLTAICFFLPFVPRGLFDFVSRVKNFKIPVLKPWVIGGGIFILCVWMFEFLSPPLIWDAVLDHFRFAGEVVRLHSLPIHWTNHTGDMPKFVEMIWAGFWAMGGEFMAKASMAISVGLTVWILMVYPASKGFPAYLGPCIFLTCPFFLALFAWGYVEGHLALFEILSLISLLEFIEKPRQKVWLLNGFFFMGAAIATKYTALLGMVGVTALLLLAKPGVFKTKMNWVLFAVFVLCPLPWYLRNGMANGNPVYPLGTGVFGGPPGFDPSMEMALWTDTGRIFGENIFESLKRLWLVFFTPENGLGASWTPLVFMSLPWGVWIKTREKRIFLLIIFTLIYFGIWALLCTNLRHGSGGCLALLVLATFLWGEAFRDGGSKAKLIFFVGIIFSFVLTLFTQIQTTAPYATAIGMEDSLVRLKRNYSFNLDTYAAYREIENNSSPRDKVLAFGVFQTYPLCRMSYVDFFWKEPILFKWAASAQTAEGLARRLKEEGVKYILYQREEAVMMSGKEKGFEVTGIPEVSYIEFWKHYANPLLCLENCTVYLVEETPSPHSFPLKDLPGLQEKIIRLVESNPDNVREGLEEAKLLLKRCPEWGWGYEIERRVDLSAGDKKSAARALGCYLRMAPGNGGMVYGKSIDVGSLCKGALKDYRQVE